MKLKYVWVILIWTGYGPAFSQGYIPTPGVQYAPATDQGPGYCRLLEKIYRAYDTGDHKYISALAAKHNKDPFLFTTCQLFRYLEKEISPDEFIQSLPTRQKEFQDFIDGSDACDAVQPPKVFEGGRIPIFEYYSQLISLMEKGNRMAVGRVLETFEFTDGEIAEGIYPDIGDFCVKHPELVLENWDLYHAHQNRLSGCFEFTSQKDLKRMRKIVLGSKGDEKAKAQFLKLIDEVLKDS